MNFVQVSPEFVDQFFALTAKAKNIAITAHVSPDDDSMASVLSVYYILTSKYPQKNIRIIYSSDPQDKYRVFKNYDKVEFVSDMAHSLGETDLVIMLDGSQHTRFTQFPEILRAIPVRICIDHHSSPIDDFSHSLVSSVHPSCAQLVYLTLCQDMEISPDLAEIFLLGILGDTGNFTYLKPHQTETLSIAKKLIEINHTEIQEFLSRYQSIPMRVFEIVQEYMANTSFSSVHGWPDFQYSFLSKKFKKEGKYTDSETSEAGGIYLSHFLRTIAGHPWGFVITPKTSGECNISARSLPNTVSVRDFMERMSLGGGHDRAAGGCFKKVRVDLEVEKCIKKVIAWLKKNKPLVA